MTAPTRAQAERWAESITLDIEPIAPVLCARDDWERPGIPLHGNLDSNLIMRAARTIGDFDGIEAAAARGQARAAPHRPPVHDGTGAGQPAGGPRLPGLPR